MEGLPFKYKVLNDEEINYMMDVKQRFFDIPLCIEIGNYFLLQLSCGLAGDLMNEENYVWSWSFKQW